MGLLSFLNTSRESSAAPAGAWRKAPFTAVSAGDDAHIVCVRDGAPFLLPAFAVDFLFGCTKFRPLDAHVAAHSAKHGWSNLEIGSLQSWVPRMIEGGLLISSAQVREKCAAMRGSERPPQIRAIGFPTGGERSALLARAVASFAENLREHGRDADLQVADSSVSAVHREAFRAVLSDLTARTGARIFYAGEDEKRRFKDALVREAGCDPAAIEFALFDPLGTGFTCGANRNAILLQSAGQLCCSVDDDVVCSISTAAKSAVGLAMFSSCDPFSRWLFADRASALASGEIVARDFLGAHEAMLGRDLGELFGDALDHAQFDVEKADDELLQRLDTGPVRIRTTFFGHAGDPGIPTSVYFLHFSDENRRRLTESEGHYRAVFGSRSVRVHVEHAAIGDASVCPGMAMGLDHRELLPPFFPVLHAEDFVFGATAWQCCPRSVAGHLPLAIQHDPPAGKPILLPGELNADRRVVVFEFAHLIRRVILDHRPAEHADATARTIALGTFLAEIAAMPARDFLHTLRRTILVEQSEKIDWLSEQLRDAGDAPEFWRRDVEAYRDHARDAVAFDDFDIPLDLKPGRTPDQARRLMQRLFAEFGALLRAWPAIFAAAKKLNETGGARLFQPIAARG